MTGAGDEEEMGYGGAGGGGGEKGGDGGGTGSEGGPRGKVWVPRLGRPYCV